MPDIPGSSELPPAPPTPPENPTTAENNGRNAFNSPQSRCDECHSGSLFSDDDGGDFNANKDQLMNNLSVPPQVQNDIIAFLSTLTDPRVAAETAPFDRPPLWSERAPTDRNPMLLGFGAVAGSGGFVPQIIATSPPKEGNTGFRVGGFGAMGDSFGFLHVDLLNVPAGVTTTDLRNGLLGGCCALRDSSSALPGSQDKAIRTPRVAVVTWVRISASDSGSVLLGFVNAQQPPRSLSRIGGFAQCVARTASQGELNPAWQ